MRWTTEPDESNPNLTHHALVLAPDEPLQPAFVMYWKRILSDGCASAATSGWRSLSIDTCDRQSANDSQGFMHAKFLNAQNRKCARTEEYFLRSDAFTLFQEPGEDNKAYDRRQLRRILEYFQMLKGAARAPDVQPLFQQISAIRPLPITAATAYDWFDLQVGEPSLGPLSAEDQALLADKDPTSRDPLLDLIPGGAASIPLLQELAAALIAYTPKSFEIICCRVTEGIEKGQRSLFYDISCPQHPDDGTTVVNDRVHRAAARLVQHIAPIQGSFPGAAVTLQLQTDGSWRHDLTLLPRQAA